MTGIRRELKMCACTENPETGEGEGVAAGGGEAGISNGLECNCLEGILRSSRLAVEQSPARTHVVQEVVRLAFSEGMEGRFRGHFPACNAGNNNQLTRPLHFTDYAMFAPNSQSPRLLVFPHISALARYRQLPSS